MGTLYRWISEGQRVKRGPEVRTGKLTTVDRIKRIAEKSIESRFLDLSIPKNHINRSYRFALCR